MGAALLGVWAGSGVWLRDSVAFAVDGRAVVVRTSARTVGEAARAAGIRLGPWDLTVPGPEARVADGLVVKVWRAQPVVFAIDGREMRVLTAAPTVGEAVARSRVPVRVDDRLEPGRDQPIVAGMRITVTRVVRSYQHWPEKIPFETVKREDMTMDIGQTKVIQGGVPGSQERLVLVTYEGGRQVSVQELSKRVFREPTTAILRVGTAGTIVREGRTLRFLKALQVTATAYDPGPISCGASASGYTAVGLKATKGIVAVDPRVIPLWSRVYVDGYGFAVAGDTGSAIKGNRIDVCFDTYDEAIHWGVKRVKVYILELPKS